MAHRFITCLCQFALALALTASAATAEAGRRIALIVGNAAYEHVPGLATPVEDAQAMGNALRDLGFEVTVLTDIGPEVFEAVLGTFATQAQDAETVLFYYAGHAFQTGGVNRLVPVTAALASQDALETETWALDSIARRLKSPDGQLLIFLDACRTNPLPEALQAGTGPGLAQYDGGAGTFVAFATAPGEVALDKTGDNSPFTGALLSNIATPGQSLSDLMITVRNAVETATGGTQTPWEQSSLRNQFFFAPQAAPKMAALPAGDLPSFDIVDADTMILDEAAAVLAGAGGRAVIQKVDGKGTVRLAALSAETRSLSVIPALPSDPARISGVDALAPGGPQAPAAADLPRAIQEELKRIGCYGMTVDGDWGNGSRNALRRYYSAKKAEADAVEPTAELWLALTKEPEKTCKPEPVAAKKKSSTTKKSTGTTQKAAPQKAAPTPAPAPKSGTKCKFMVVAIVCS